MEKINNYTESQIWAFFWGGVLFIFGLMFLINYISNYYFKKNKKNERQKRF